MLHRPQNIYRCTVRSQKDRYSVDHYIKYNSKLIKKNEINSNCFTGIIVVDGVLVVSTVVGSPVVVGIVVVSTVEGSSLVVRIVVVSVGVVVSSSVLAVYLN